MAKFLIEPEEYLLANWDEARRLEQTMVSVREKLKLLLSRVEDKLKMDLPDLDDFTVYTAFDSPGYISLGRKAWPGNGDDVTGFFIEGLRIEHLTSNDDPNVLSYFYLSPKTRKLCDINEATARTHFEQIRNHLSSNFELVKVEDRFKKGMLLVLAGPQKQKLLAGLKTDDAAGFVSMLVEHFKVLAKFVPAVDALLQYSKSISEDPA